MPCWWMKSIPWNVFILVTEMFSANTDPTLEKQMGMNHTLSNLMRSSGNAMLPENIMVEYLFIILGEITFKLERKCLLSFDWRRVHAHFVDC